MKANVLIYCVAEPAGGRLLEWFVSALMDQPLQHMPKSRFGKVHLGQMSTKHSCCCSSWTTCRCEGGSCVRLCGLCVLASSNQSEWNHQKIHRFLLQSPSHSKTTNTQPQACRCTVPLVCCWLTTFLCSVSVLSLNRGNVFIF